VQVPYGWADTAPDRYDRIRKIVSSLGSTSNADAPDVIVNHGPAYASNGYGGSILLQAQRQRGVPLQGFKRATGRTIIHGGALRLDEHLYDAGHEARGWFCLGGEKEAKRWQTDGEASRTCADGMLYCLDERGTMPLVQTTPERWSQVSSFRRLRGGKGLCWAHPIVCRGQALRTPRRGAFCVRHPQELIAGAPSGLDQPYCHVCRTISSAFVPLMLRRNA
jgi:hypothetical protein